jgi:asparagine synthase (glutamine-hydrolysing)
MCGLLTFISSSSAAVSHQDSIAQALESLHHRGPDETGVVLSGDDLVLAFKRLSIIDVGDSHQPLEYLDGRYVLTSNGEIYNYLELREELTREHGAQFATNGDMETVAAAYHYWGPQGISRLRGMFAFILWDRQEKVAFGARDFYGIKPLFYLENADGLYVASEKKALMPFSAAAKAGDAGVDMAALSHYLTLQYVPEPATLHKDIKRVECGESFSWSQKEGLSIRRYYRPRFRPAPVSEPDKLFGKIQDALRESVALHLRSDVPVGAFLSSGIDSTAIVALAREHKPDILTFTAGYDVEGYSEIEVAQESARYLGVKSIPAYVTADDMMSQFPRMIWHLDDPVADPALVPLYFVAKKAAEHVTVVLSGEGADEFFGGYGIYREPLSLRHLQALPGPLQRGLHALSKVIPEGVRGKSYFERGTTPIEERYYGNARIFTEQEKSKLMKTYDPAVSYTQVTAKHYEDSAGWDDSTRMQYIDLYTWLRGDILVKADRMSMAHSLELRVPFLDTGVFDVAATIPRELKVTDDGIRKYALRKALDGVVPPQIVNRKKLGFPVPTRVWLKTLMYDWAADILSTSGAGELLDLPYALRLLEAHKRGDADYSRKIWTVLAFCIWHAIFVEGSIDPRPERATSRLAS